MQDSSPFQYIAIDQLFESKTNPRQTADGTASATAYSLSASVIGVTTAATFALTNAVAPTTITTTPSATTLVYGQPVTLSSSIKPASVLTSAPSGLVKYTEGATVLISTAAVSSAAASYIVSVPTVMTHTYAAQYLGDTNFASSTATNASSTVCRQGKRNTYRADGHQHAEWHCKLLDSELVECFCRNRLPHHRGWNGNDPRAEHAGLGQLHRVCQLFRRR
jgi:hypothetical protein